MMILLYFMLIFLLVYALTPTKSPVKSATCNKMHKWIWKNEGTEEEYLACSVCNKTPSQLVSEVNGIEL